MCPSFESVNDVCQTGRAFRQVRRIDLSDVPHTNDLGAGARTGDQGLHLFGREVLCFVDDHELVQERATAHEAHALDLDAASDQIVRGASTPVVAAFDLIEHFKVIFQGTHGSIFSSSVPGKKPISSPTLTVARVKMISEKRRMSIVWLKAAANVINVLPVPA